METGEGVRTVGYAFLFESKSACKDTTFRTYVRALHRGLAASRSRRHCGGGRGPEEQPLEIWGRFRPAVRYPVGRHAALHVGPIIAWTSSGPSSMRLSAVVPRIELQRKVTSAMARGGSKGQPFTYSRRRAT